MTIDAARFQKLLGEFKLEQLFNELGWEGATRRPHAITAQGESFTLSHLAHKRGVAVLLCSPDASGKVPARPVLLKIEKEAVKHTHEHLLVFTDAAHNILTWLWVSRTPGQPIATRTHTWHKGQSGEALRQKLTQIVWSLEAEEAITLTDVITGLRRAFDRDRVSKSFYEKFKAQHDAFAGFIDGLASVADKTWYASLMLNRLMFVYFIQKKGFLDGSETYLRDRLTRVQAEEGKGKFHSFYRQFLRRLFHEGLGLAKGDRSAELTRLIGDVPYLNGGLFSLHELEEANPGIDVPDEAFEHLFAFFDAWDWHLDDRPLSKGTEINPDVLGYIFEKYINQKQMGAYYTKEDITEYISKNTVIPHLLEQARERCKVAFDGESSVWHLLKADPDRYLYPAMKTGVIDASGGIVPESALPDFVQTGMRDANARMFERRYNLGEAVFTTTAGERGTLPTETWREYVDRRSRSLAIRDKLVNGEVKSTDDLITLNLDIRQFMQDVIDTCTGPDLLRAIWQAIVGRVPEKSNEKFRHGITILDPTCGSGAFLFAALGVLEPLYEACLDRMEGFVEDARKLGKTGEPDFVRALAEVDKHPSRRYYIYKSIILHNLFGVDIMAEAVEICKLRLFLKLVSQVDAGRELEPLPDIDFNIRTGNTLVGYATEAQFDAANTLASDQTHRDEIKANMADLADAFNFFRGQQTVHGGKVTAEDKRRLRGKLSNLSLELDKYLARDYGVDPTKPKAFAAWRESHQPFHWSAEFYGVMHEGGFDVVIGNPPYVEYSKVRDCYTLIDEYAAYSTNLFAACCYRARQLCPSGREAFIVPISLPSTDRMQALRAKLAEGGGVYHVDFNTRPGKLFEGAEQRLTIYIRHPSKGSSRKSGGYLNWSQAERPALFQTLSYIDTTDILLRNGIWPKVRGPVEANLIRCLQKFKPLNATKMLGGGDAIFYKNTGLRYFNSATLRPPKCWINGVATSSSRETILRVDSDSKGAVHAVLLSTSFFFYWQVTSNCRDLNPSDIHFMPMPAMSSALGASLKRLSDEAEIDYTSKGRIIRMHNKKTGVVELESVTPSKSKDAIDRIELAIVDGYGMSAEQLDFMLNYAIKYRVGDTGEDQ
ncbi:MAG: SAM-dependent methyltransferase [Burkholderiales bacterium PBB3]|nr:MAG: SAM-dependent methyltransferase [Burkholderiales bacterium PBB3]